MKKILCFDTSTPMFSVALSADDQIFSQQQLAPRQHAQLLLPTIEGLLAEAKLKLAELDAITFGQGPGSFMGLRVACTVAKTLAYASKIPLIGLSTLRVVAQTAFAQHKLDDVIVAMDARMGEIYFGHYYLDDQQLMQSQQQDQLLKPEDIPQFSVPVVGSAAGLLAAEDKHYPDILPLATSMLPLAQFELQQQHTLDAMSAQPIYLRNNVATKKEL